MARKAFIQQEIIDGSVLNPAGLQCPRCSGNTLVLHGTMQINAWETMEDGVIVEQKTDAEDSGAFDVTRIDCLPCNVTFQVRDPQLYRLEYEILKLSTQIKKMERVAGRFGGGGSSALLNDHEIFN